MAGRALSGEFPAWGGGPWGSQWFGKAKQKSHRSLVITASEHGRPREKVSKDRFNATVAGLGGAPGRPAGALGLLAIVIYLATEVADSTML